MKTSLTDTLRATLVATALAMAGHGPSLAQGQEEVRATHGDWAIRCAPAQNVCVMQQTGKGAEGNDLLDVRIRKLDGVTAENGENVPGAIQIAAPLGVLLRAGVRVQVDGGKVRAAPFEICIAGGCVVRDVMSEEFLGQMKSGSTAKMTIVSPQAGEVSVNISLRGFTKAFGSL